MSEDHAVAKVHTRPCAGTCLEFEQREAESAARLESVRNKAKKSEEELAAKVSATHDYAHVHATCAMCMPVARIGI